MKRNLNGSKQKALKGALYFLVYFPKVVDGPTMSWTFSHFIVVLLVSLALQKGARYNSENTRNIGKRQKSAFSMQDLCWCYLSKIYNTRLDCMTYLEIDQFDLKVMRPDHLVILTFRKIVQWPKSKQSIQNLPVLS